MRTATTLPAIRSWLNARIPGTYRLIQTLGYEGYITDEQERDPRNAKRADASGRFMRQESSNNNPPPIRALIEILIEHFGDRETSPL